MLDLHQLKFNLIRPTLQAIDLWSETAENLILGTILQESGAHFLVQKNGIALGICQIEPFTFLDIRHRMMLHLELLHKILDYLDMKELPENPNCLIGNMTLSIIICRLKFYLDPRPLPENSPTMLAQFYKAIYNSSKGAATIEVATKNFQIACTCT